MGRMLVIVPVSRHDTGLICSFCGAMNFFAPYSEHSLLVVSRPSDKDFASRAFNLLSRAGFKDSQMHLFADDGNEGWPQGPNHYWVRTIEHLRAIENKLPWLWLEMDSCPLQNNWLDKIEQDHQRGGKPFSGVKTRIPNVPEHVTGVAVYPPQIPFDVSSALHTPKAFDVLFANIIVPETHETKLIHHNYHSREYHCVKGEWACTSENKVEEYTPRAACLLHGVTDGSLAVEIINQPKFALARIDNRPLLSNGLLHRHNQRESRYQR